MLPDQKAEEWKPIPGYEGIYDASSYGRIRSTPGKTTSNERFAIRVWKTRIIKPKTQNRKRKDERVSLWKDGIEKDYLVSRLVASAWYGMPDEGMTVNHINGNPMDNRPENLEWISLAENIQKGFMGGLYDSTFKPVDLVDNNGNTISFKTRADASIFLNRSNGYISNLLRKNKNTATSSDGAEYKVKIA